MSFVSFVSEKLTSSKEMGTSSKDTLFPPCCWSCPAPGKKPGRGGMNGEESKEEEEGDLEEGGVDAAGLGLPLGLGAVGGGFVLAWEQQREVLSGRWCVGRRLGCEREWKACI